MPRAKRRTGRDAPTAPEPKEIKLENIARLNRDYLCAAVTKRAESANERGAG